MAFDLGEKNCKFSLGDGQRAPNRCMVTGGNRRHHECESALPSRQRWTSLQLL